MTSRPRPNRLPSLRTTFVVHGVQRYLAYMYGEYAAAHPAAEAATA